MNRFVWFLVVLMSPCFAFAEIEVTDLKGRKMKVDVLAYTESSGNTRIKRVSDGAVFNVKISIFDKDSQLKIAQAAPKAKAKLVSKVSVGRRRERLGSSSYMKKQTITAKVTIENDSRDIDFPKGKGTVLLVARQTRRYSDNDADYGKILHKEQFSAALKAGETFKFECKPVITEYDSDRDSSNIGGWEYFGWMLVVEESDGTIHSVETSIGNLKKETEEDPQIGEIFKNLKVDQLVEKNLSKKQ